MKQPLNPEKSKKLRPLRVVLAILIAVLVVLILDRLPTSVKDRETNRATNQQTIEKRATPEGAKYYYFTGFLELLEDQTEEKLQKLGVPEEDYQNLAEYLTKDEMFEIETKATLAANLESVYVEVDESDLKDLRQIFDLDDDYDFDQFRQAETAPNEYKILADLLKDYHKTLTTTEDYDAPAE